MSEDQSIVRVGILGASGYTGAELVRLLSRHPRCRLVALTGDRAAGKPMGDVFPHLDGLDLPDLIRIEDLDYGRIDFIFCALPHGTTQEIIKRIRTDHPGIKICDLSADFRLDDVEVYAEWYGHAHLAPDLQKEAVYGLTELNREAIRGASLVANPGCYPTPPQLTLVPLVEAGLIDVDDIVIDAKSGVSGAGRGLKEANLYAEAAEGIHAYAVGKHRHSAEIEQALSGVVGRAVRVTFVPHMMPMNRGILDTMYVTLKGRATVEALHERLAGRFEGEPFIRVLPLGNTPATRHVRGTNQVRIGVAADRNPRRAILVAVEDNLTKGASGQAVQNMNLQLGFPETLGLEQVALFP